MNKSYEDQYLDKLENILKNGYKDEGRNGVTIKLPNQIVEVNLWEGFPILTTKKVFFKTAMKEMLWMFRDQSNDVTLLQEQNVHIWDKWVDENNTIGKSYGYQVNNSGQFDKLIDNLKNNDQCRRMIVTLWNPKDIPEMTLEPCCVMTIWDVCDASKCVGESEYPTKEKYLNCTLVQRSADTFLGEPFDMVEYAALTHMIAQVTGLKPGKLTHIMTNNHIYEEHIDAVKQQLSRREEMKNPPTLKLNPEITNFYDFKLEDIELENYENCGPIRAEVKA